MLRILRQLVHVDDVRNTAKLVQGGQCTAPLEPRFDRDQKEDRDPEKDHVIDGRLDALHEVRPATRSAGEPNLRGSRSCHGEHRDDREDDSHAYRPVGRRQIGDMRCRLAGDRQQLLAHARQTRRRKSLGDPVTEPLECFNNAVVIELPVSRVGTRLDRRVFRTGEVGHPVGWLR